MTTRYENQELRNYKQKMKPRPPNLVYTDDVEGMYSYHNLDELGKGEYYRASLHISLEGNFKVGLTTLLRNLSKLPWLDRTKFFEQDTDELTRLNMDPDRVLGKIPWGCRFSSFRPNAIWKLSAGRPGIHMDSIMERSEYSVCRVELPFWHLAFQCFRTHDFKAPPNAPYFAPVDRYSGCPDVMIYLMSCPQKIAHRSTPSPKGIRRVGFAHERLEQMFDNFAGPKFKLNSTGLSPSELTSSVSDILSYVRVQNMGYLA